eukprot:3935988-Rhodomonas_salina.1
MGTRGWFVLKWRGRYFRIYNQYDSNHSGLGFALVEELQAAGGLRSEALLAAWRDLLDLGVVVLGEKGPQLEAPQDAEKLQRWQECLSQLGPQTEGELSSPVSHWFRTDARYLAQDSNLPFLEIDCGIMIQYVYVIDLDDCHFYATTDDKSFAKRFPLEDIPADWIRQMEDEGGTLNAFPIPDIVLDEARQALLDSGYIAGELLSTGRVAIVLTANSTQRDEQKELRREVVIKMVFKRNKQIRTDPETPPPFSWGMSGGFDDLGKVAIRRNAEIAQLVHKAQPEGIVEVLDVLTIRVKMFTFVGIVMEKYDGFLLGESQELNFAGVCDIMVQVANGVAWMHEHGLVHHDIKPENILCRVNGDKRKAVLCDFDSVCKRGQPGTGQRWAEGWARFTYTRHFLHPQHETVEQWHIDHYALAEIFRDLCKTEPRLSRLADPVIAHLKNHTTAEEDRNRLRSLGAVVDSVLQGTPFSKRPWRSDGTAEAPVEQSSVKAPRKRVKVAPSLPPREPLEEGTDSEAVVRLPSPLALQSLSGMGARGSVASDTEKQGTGGFVTPIVVILT